MKKSKNKEIAVDNELNSVRKSVGRVLVDTKEILTKCGWVQETSGSYSYGFCLSGALRTAGNGLTSNYLPCIKLVCEAAQLKIKTFDKLANWNDVKGRTKEQIFKVLNKAIDKELYFEK